MNRRQKDAEYEHAKLCILVTLILFAAMIFGGILLEVDVYQQHSTLAY